MACVWRQCSKALCQTKLASLTPTLSEPHLGQQCGVRWGSLLPAINSSLPISSTRSHSSGFAVAMPRSLAVLGWWPGDALMAVPSNASRGQTSRSSTKSFRKGRICGKLSQEGQSEHCKQDQTFQSFARQLQVLHRGPLLFWHRSLTAISRTASALLASSRLLEVVLCLLLDRAPR